MKNYSKSFLPALLAVLACAGPTQAAPPTPPTRVWHVSVAPLPAVPSGQQFRTVGEAAGSVQPGDVVLIHTGVYRESVTISRSGTTDRPIRFQSAPGATVVITGADRLSGLAKEPGADNVFSVAWPYRFLDETPHHAHPEDDEHLLIGRAEQVFVQNYPLRQVLRRDQISRGTFFADLDAKRLYVWSADNADLGGNGVPVEASTRSVLWTCKGDYVFLHGVCFRDAANAAQQGAAEFDGRGDVVEDCTFEDTNARGASFAAADQIVRRCTFRDNGQMGFGAAFADRLLVTDCLIQNNNIKDFGRWFEAGGNKIVMTRGAVIARCRVLDNRGVGLWFDIGNENCDVHNCLIAGNEDAGVFYEISYGLHAHDNVIVGNGLADTPGAWGGQAGVCLSSSPDCVVERNLLVGNKEGFAFREQARTTPRRSAKPGAPEEAVWNHDEVIRHNVLADNRDAQVWGWFDVSDERQWPRAAQEKRPDVAGTARSLADAYIARDKSGQPVGLSLEKLHLTFNDNLYDAPDGQGLFHWGTAWRRHRYYDTLTAVLSELGVEQGSAVAPFAMADSSAMDFRVSPGALALKMDDYPHGSVPGALLGTATRAHP